MAIKEIFKTPSGIRLLGGLEWRLLDPSQKVDAALRAVASERSATHVATATALTSETIKTGKKTKEVHRVAGGFYSNSDDGGPGKKAHSLAAAFATWTAQHEKAALAVSSGENVAIVIVLNGLPALDKVVDNFTEAFSIVNGYRKDHPEMSVFSDDIERFPSSLMEAGILEAIAAAANKNTVIKEVPVDLGKLALIALVVIGALGGYQYYTIAKAEQARKAALARQAMEDPVPKYLNALTAQKNSVGVDRAELLSAFNAIKLAPLEVGGWALKSINCVKAVGCSAEYTRTTGTYKTLTDSVRLMKIDLAGSMNLNNARMVWDQSLKPASIDSAEPPLTTQAFIEGVAGSMFQNWMVAGIGLNIQAPMLWPQVPGVPANFKHPSAIAMGKFEVSDVPLPVVEEIITKAPSNIIWSGISAQAGDAKSDAMSRVKVTVTGNYYVKN